MCIGHANRHGHRDVAPPQPASLVRRSQILSTQSRTARDACEHARTDLVAVVEGEHEVRLALASQDTMRPGRSLDRPAAAEKRRQDEPCLGGRPVAHAASKRSVT